jgi:acylphosphatase
MRSPLTLLLPTDFKWLRMQMNISLSLDFNCDPGTAQRLFFTTTTLQHPRLPSQTQEVAIAETLMADRLLVNRQVLARISGRVQGVWFRAWTKTEADARNLSGWVRNEPDGSVTAFLSGPPVAVDDMLAVLWQGPPAAQVSHVAVEKMENEAVPDGFAVTG